MKKLLVILSLIITFANASTLGIQEHLGDTVDVNLTFLNEKGKSVTLKEMMAGKPTILTLNYFRCAGICTPQLNELARVLGKLELAENKDYKIVTISFAEDEPFALAAAKKKNMINSIKREFVPNAWNFAIGENNSSHILSEQVGFVFEQTVTDEGKVDYIHGAALIILSPEGKITRYLNGVNQLPFDVKMAITEASTGTVGATVAKMVQYCFSYDPKGRTYIFMWEKVVGLFMFTLMFGFFFYLVKKGRKEDDREVVRIEEEE